MNADPSSNSQREPNPFDWVAFRYIAGELTQPEIDSFEQELAENLLAQQAFADAVQIQQLTRAALQPPKDQQVKEAKPAYSVSRNTDQRWTGSAVGKLVTGGLAMAILIGLVSGLSWWAAQRDFPGIAESGNQDQDHEVADLWANSIVDASAESEIDLIDSDNEVDDSLTNVVNDLESENDTVDPESAWLVDALKEFSAEPMTPSGSSM